MQDARTNGNVSCVILNFDINKLMASDNNTEIKTQIPSLIWCPANTIAHNTALKLNSPMLISLIGAENLNAIIADNIAPANPYNAEIGELIKTAIKNSTPDTKLP